ncbi:MAG: mannose-1-phosphate guanylyltransferase [Limisphaera sp.]
MKNTASSKERYVVLMAGGRGERFWPLSREKTPKQLLRLWGRKSLLQLAVERLQGLVPPSRVFVITTAVQAAEVRRQLPRLPRANVVIEPMGRDTCAAVALGAAVVAARCPGAVMAMLPADHVIHDAARFRQTLADAFDVAAREPVIVTLGIPPTEPATGYGYIRVGERLELPHNSPRADTIFHKAEAFVEKPTVERAREFLQTGRYRWNAGMFVWSVPTLLRGLEEHQPRIHAACQRWIATGHSPARLARLLRRDYPTLPRISIDYALMERATNVVVADASFDWDDVGSWSALARHLPRDAAGNTLQADCVTVDASGNLVLDARPGSARTLIALVGVQGLVVVHTRDAVLIVPKDQAQKVRDLVRKLETEPKYRSLL